MNLRVTRPSSRHPHTPIVAGAIGLAVAFVLAGCSVSTSVELPPADYDRAGTWQTHMVNCLQDEGWDVIATEGGSLNFTEGGIDSSQYESYTASVKTCEQSSGLPTWDDLSEA